jgi:glycosyltransferase involved in cell wall biosynthesis
MIRVLHYGLSSNKGGIETYIMNLASHVDRERFNFDFLHNKAGVPCFREELKAMGSEFYGVTPRRTSPFKNRQELNELFERESFDILHCHVNSLSYIEPVHTALRSGCQVLVHSHNSGASTSLATNLLHRLHYHTLPRDKVTMVAVSRIAGEWVFGPSASFNVIHNGIEIERFAFRAEAREAKRKELGLSGRLVIGHVGAFLPAKNHAFLLNVFYALLQEVPQARLLLVGTGPLESAIRMQAAKMGIGAALIFLGHRSDVPELMSAMDLFLIPSLHEGFPLAALEAQASGLPCIMSDAIAEEVVVASTCKRISLNASTERWVREIRSACSVEVGTRQLGARSVSEFSFENNLDKVESLYSAIAAN